MSVSILTSGYWPSYPVLEAKLPEELTQHQAVFKDFYLSKHSGRRLVWHNSLGTCNVKARFTKGTKELALSLFQVRAASKTCGCCCRTVNNLNRFLWRVPWLFLIMCTPVQVACMRTSFV